jgi:hypothetical protein
MYNAPVPSDSLAGVPSNLIEKSKTGSINGWIFYGESSLAEISHLLTVEPKPEIHIWITVRATSNATPLSLIYETNMYRPTSYRWDSKNNPLEITEARVVATTAAASVEDSTIPGRIAGSPFSAVSEAVFDNIRSLDAKVGRMGLTIVVLLGVILIELWRRF